MLDKKVFSKETCLKVGRLVKLRPYPTSYSGGHFNSCQPRWYFADIPENYKYSSAGFYETGIKE